MQFVWTIMYHQIVSTESPFLKENKFYLRECELRDLRRKPFSKAEREWSRSRSTTLMKPSLMRGRIGKVPSHSNQKREWRPKHWTNSVQPACWHWRFQVRGWSSNPRSSRRCCRTGWESEVSGKIQSSRNPWRESWSRQSGRKKKPEEGYLMLKLILKAGIENRENPNSL